ncbi:MAG: AzlD domain-containing protein [Actinomycetes bacterium]
MSSQWISVIGTSFFCYAFKFLGHSLPGSWFNHPRAQRINTYIPIVLLMGLVTVQSFTEKTKLVIDHRAAGIAVAFAALLAKAPFPVVITLAGVSSALVYRFG